MDYPQSKPVLTSLGDKETSKNKTKYWLPGAGKVVDLYNTLTLETFSVSVFCLLTEHITISMIRHPYLLKIVEQ